MKNALHVDELRKLLSRNDANALRNFCTSSHPGAIADILSTLTPREVWNVLSLPEPRLRAEIFGHLSEELQIELAESLKRQDLAQVVTYMSADERVDLLKRLPEEKQETLLPVLAQAEREDIRRLSSYSEGTAGSVMTSDYATLSPKYNATEAIAKLRKEAPDKETIYYSYAVDPDRKLLGFISLKDLILARPETPVDNIMHRDVIFARTDEDQEEAANKIA